MHKENIKSAIHLLAGLIAIFHGYVLYINGETEYSFLYIITGVFFIIIGFTSKAVKAGFIFKGGIFFLLESIIISLISRYNLIERNHLSGYIYAMLSLLYFGLAIFYIRRKIFDKHNSRIMSNPGRKYKRM